MTPEARFPGLKFLVGLASLFILLFGLRSAQAIFVPCLFAFFLAVMGTGPLGWLQRRSVPKTVSVFVVALGMLLIVAAVGTLLVSSINEFSKEAPKYAVEVKALRDGIALWLGEQGVLVEPGNSMGFIDPSAFIDVLGSWFKRLVMAVSSALVVVILMLFALFEATEFRQKLQLALGPAFDRSKFIRISDDVRHYLVIKTFTSMVTGFLVGIVVFLFGIDFWLLWGLLAFIMNYIPMIGSFLASLPAILLCLIQFGITPALVIAVIYLIVNVGVSNFLEPILMGKRLGLSPLIVFLSLLIWGWIWGPAGMLLSVPLTMVVKIILEHSEEFRWVALLMGNAPRIRAEAALS